MYTFKKEERLCNKRLIDGLFHNGSSFLCYPFKVSWQFAKLAGDHPAQVLLGVSKKRYKRAVDRNQIKRLMREAYRLQKQQYLYSTLLSCEKRIVFSVNYIGKEIVPHDVAKKKMLKLLNQLAAEVQK